LFLAVPTAVEVTHGVAAAVGVADTSGEEYGLDPTEFTAVIK
jgi:hypothetical protein